MWGDIPADSVADAFFPVLRLLPGMGGRSPARRGAWGEAGISCSAVSFVLPCIAAAARHGQQVACPAWGMG